MKLKEDKLMFLGKDAVLRGGKKPSKKQNNNVDAMNDMTKYEENADNTFKVFAANNLRNTDRRIAVAMEIRDSKRPGIIEAELVFQEGDSIIVDWNNISEREKHLHMINGYTLIYDRREKRQFSEWKKKQA